MFNRSVIKYITLITGAFAFIIGWIVALSPLESSVFVNYILVIALGIAGIAQICQYLSAKNKDAWGLVLGILYLVGALALLSNGAMIIQATAGYVLAFLALMDAVRHFAWASEAKGLFGISPSMLIVGGVIEVLVAAFLIVAPIATQTVYFWIFGVFLITYGLITFIRGLAIKTGK